MGRAHDNSDVSLLVVMPFGGKGLRMPVEILKRVEPEFPVNVIVHTPRQLRERLALDDFFLSEVVTNGKVLYEANTAKTLGLTIRQSLILQADQIIE